MPSGLGSFSLMHWAKRIARHTKVDRVSSHNIIDIHHRLAPSTGKVEHTTDVVLLEHLTEGTLVLLGELDHLDGDLLLRRRLDEVLDLLVRGEQLVAQGGEVVDDLGQPLLLQLTAEEETLAGLGHAEVHGGLERRPVSLDQVLAEAGHLTSGGHLDAKEGVGTGKTGPGELRNLGGKVVALDGHQVGWLGNVLADERLGGDVNEVGTQDLADEGERSRGTQVALNDLQLRLTAFGILSLDDLHVERTSDVPGLGNLLGNLLDTAQDLVIQRGGRKNQSSITRVDTSLLNVLTDGMDNELALGSNTVDVELLRALDELADDDRVVGRDIAGSLKLVLELILAVNDSHGGTGQDVTGSDEHRVADLVSELLSRLDGGELLPCGLVKANAIEDGRELLSVLSLVDILGVSTENVGLSSLLEAQSDVLRQLSTDGDNDTVGTLKFVDIHNTLVAQLLEVQLVSSIEVSASLGGADGTPIELDGATDTVNTAAQDDRSLVIERHVVSGGVVGGVEVVGVSRELGSQGVNLLDPWPDAVLQTKSADLVLSAVHGVGNLPVGETHLLGLDDEVLLQALEATDCLELLGAVNNVLQLVQEPLVDLGQLVDLVHRVVLVHHSLANGEPSTIRRVLELKVEVVELVTLEANELGVHLANGLLERLLEGSANSHNLTDGLHSTADIALNVLELGKIPSRDLGNDVVKRGLEVRRGRLRDGIWKLGEGVAETNLRSRVGKRTIWLQGILDVALADDAQVANNLDGCGTEHVVLLVTQSLTGRNDNGVSSVDSERVEVLHVADSNAVVVGVPDNLVLDLLPALERLLDQNLRGQRQRASGHVSELLLVVCETRSKTSQGVSGTDNDGVTDALCGIQGLLNSVDSNRLRNGDVDLVQGPGEEVTILTELQCSDTGSQNLDAVFLEDAHLLHLDTEVQGGLATKGEEDTIGSFALDNVGDIFRGNRDWRYAQTASVTERNI
ncbi:hypothetical protein VMCG_06224 [Cytospora schulzeri]|uniref:Uncharacterized protein n=1 Tax=Cytospora schulzeri TaxID=448051 RepID=A0A423W9B1_9PEZI|nr:hypothetical protein VMCG_06224 [Valsa malicola]